MTDVSASAMPFGPSSVAPGHGQQTKGKPMEKLCAKAALKESDIDADQRWFANLCWRACPGARSEKEVAATIAHLLSTNKHPINARTVENWLRCDHTPHFRYIGPIILLAGGERLISMIDREVS